MTTAPRSRRWFAILLLTLLGLALRAFHMNAQNLWFDEIGSARVATMPVADLVRAVENHGSVEPTAWLSMAYYALVKTVLWLPHATPDWLLRATSVAIGTLCIPACAWAASAFLPRAAALTATFVLAVSPFHVWYSQEARPYGLLVLLTLLAIGSYVRALASSRAAWWAAVAVAVTLALYTHPTALALAAVLGIGVAALALHDVRRALAGGAALVAAGLAFLPAVLVIGRHGANHAADLRPVGWLDLPYAFYAYAVGFSLGPSTAELHGDPAAPLLAHLPVIVVAALAFGWLAARGARATRRMATPVALLLWSWLVVPLALALVVAMSTANPFNVRYAIIAYPAFVAIIALGITDHPTRASRVAAMAALVLCAASIANLYFDPRYAKEDCRGLGRILEAEAHADDLVIVNAGYMAMAVSYYYQGSAEVIGYPPPTAAGPFDSHATREDLARLTAGKKRVWLVATRTFHGDRARVLQQALGADRRLEWTRQLTGITARRYGSR